MKNYSPNRWLMDTDGMLQNKLMRTKIYHAIAENRHKSIEYNILRLKKIDTLGK
jgi:hypothetical protein